MIMLDKARASVWIKVGAAIIVLAFVLAYIPYASVSDFSDFFKSLFQSETSAGDQQAQAKIVQLKAKLKTNPNSKDDLIELGNLYYDTEKYQNAITYYERALKLDPKNYDVMTDMGASYYALGQTDKALEIFKLVTAEKPDHAMAWFNLGIVYQSKQDTPNMNFAWARFLALQPTGDLADQVRQQLDSQAGQTSTTPQQ